MIWLVKMADGDPGFTQSASKRPTYNTQGMGPEHQKVETQKTFIVPPVFFVLIIL